MLTGLVSAQGDFHDALKLLVSAPPAEAAPTIRAAAATRLIRCQVDEPELEALRDEILVPILLGQLDGPKLDSNVLEDVADLLALVPDPTEPIALANFSGVVARVQKALPDKKKGALSIDERHAAAEQQMKNPTRCAGAARSAGRKALEGRRPHPHSRSPNRNGEKVIWACPLTSVASGDSGQGSASSALAFGSVPSGLAAARPLSVPLTQERSADRKLPRSVFGVKPSPRS